ncbi:SCO family protein [Lysobacter enzymogenes]|uniref:SCO family protein n=1 Tax=Lysobacter enzymogenes TaxID=69 RepID=UPI001A96B0B4|nr:SCO family protein [Lysobacter enzymogenes]QQP97247.1 SCO family protein [Lysobacter enzymogenes]
MPRIEWFASMLVLAALAAPARADTAHAAPVAPAASADPEARGRAYFGDAELTDQDGRRQRFYSDLLSDKVVLINVVFTRCPSACPLMTQHLKAVRRQLGDRFGRQVRFLSLSVDPAYDTPQAMKRFAAQQGVDEPGWRFLVADEATTRAVLGRLGQWSDKAEDHTTLLIAGNARRAHWTKLRPDAPPERIAADLRRLAGESL